MLCFCQTALDFAKSNNKKEVVFFLEAQSSAAAAALEASAKKKAVDFVNFGRGNEREGERARVTLAR